MRVETHTARIIFRGQGVAGPVTILEKRDVAQPPTAGQAFVIRSGTPCGKGWLFSHFSWATSVQDHRGHKATESDPSPLASPGLGLQVCATCRLVGQVQRSPFAARLGGVVIGGISPHPSAFDNLAASRLRIQLSSVTSACEPVEDAISPLATALGIGTRSAGLEIRGELTRAGRAERIRRSFGESRLLLLELRRSPARRNSHSGPGTATPVDGSRSQVSVSRAYCSRVWRERAIASPQSQDLPAPHIPHQRCLSTQRTRRRELVKALACTTSSFRRSARKTSNPKSHLRHLPL